MSDIVRTSQPIVAKLIISETIASNGVFTSDEIDLTGIIATDGYFSIQIVATGNGTATIEYLASNDGVTFISPSSSTEITTGFTDESGNGSDGKDVISFSPVPCKYMQIVITETSATDSITINGTLIAQ